MVGFDRKIIKLYFFSQQRLQHLSSRFECNLSSFKRNKEHEILSYLYKTGVGLQMLNNGITTYNILFIVFIIFFLLKKDLDGTFLKIIFLLYTSIAYTTK